MPAPGYRKKARIPTAGHRPAAQTRRARLATQAGDTISLGRTFLNLSHELAPVDPAAAAEAARTAVGYLRRTGARDYVAVTIANLSQALLMLGEWDAAEAELAQADDIDGLADNEISNLHRAWLAALRGDADRAKTILTALPDLLASDEPQAQALVSLVEAFTAAARRPPETTLSQARATLAYADAVGTAHEATRWAWPLAARTAWELGEGATTQELLAMLDALQPGRLPPMLRAERDLARARANGSDLATSIASLRELSTPYHLAHGLLDYAEELTRQSETEAAAAAAEEATAIAVQLRCQPLLGRVADIMSRAPHAVLPLGENAPGPPATAAAGARPRTRATGTRP